VIFVKKFFDIFLIFFFLIFSDFFYFFLKVCCSDLELRSRCRWANVSKSTLNLRLT